MAVTHDELLIYRLITCSSLSQLNQELVGFQAGRGNWITSELFLCHAGCLWKQNFNAHTLKNIQDAKDGLGVSSTHKHALGAEKAAAMLRNQKLSVLNPRSVPISGLRLPSLPNSWGMSQEELRRVEQTTPTAPEPKPELKPQLKPKSGDVKVPPWLVWRKAWRRGRTL